MLFEIGGLGSGKYDVLNINGSATFTGGNVEFDFINGFSASAGNSWDFLLANSINGWNSLDVELAGLNNGLGWEVESETLPNGYVEEELLITAQNGGGDPVPEPSTFALFGIGLLALLGWARRIKAV